MVIDHDPEGEGFFYCPARNICHDIHITIQIASDTFNT